MFVLYGEVGAVHEEFEFYMRTLSFVKNLISVGGF